VKSGFPNILRPWKDSGDADGGRWFMPLDGGWQLCIVASSGCGWDHVSVSARLHGTPRTPSWDQMAWVKARFFEDEETVIQFHPKASEAINFHPNVLHMWRKHGAEVELPPWWMIGPKPGMTRAEFQAETARIEHAAEETAEKEQR
jgi:hypothetical protein